MPLDFPLSDLALLERGATFFPLPCGDKDPPPPYVTGKKVNVRLNAAQRKALHGGPNDNVGLLLGHFRIEMPDGSYRGVFVIDEDNKPERVRDDGTRLAAQVGAQTIAVLERELGPLPRTLTSLTPGLGKHRLVWAPDEIVDLPAKVLRRDPRFKEGCGVEILTEGRYIVYPGSRLSPEVAAIKGFVPGTYRWEDPTAPIAELPQAWVDYLLDLPGIGAGEIQASPGDVTDPKELEYRRERYTDYLQHVAPCVQGQAGDERLFSIAQFGAYDLALPASDVQELVAEHFNPRCVPPWDEDDLEYRLGRKIQTAKEGSTRERLPLLLKEEEEVLDWKAPLPEHPDAAPNDFGFKIRRGGWNEKPTAPKYLVEHLFVANKVNMIFAEPGTIKSWVAQSIAAAVSSGERWLGEREVARGTTLYVDFEDGEHEVHRRVHLLTGGEDRPDLWYLYTPGDLNNWELWKKLIDFVLKHNVSFVVFDTLAGGTPGVDENDRNAATALQYAGRFTECTPATVLFLHHANRAGEIRGTSAFKANVDALFKLETIKDEDNIHRAKLTCTKSGHKKVFPISLELTDGGLKKLEEPKSEDEATEEAQDDKKDRRTLQQLKAEVLLLIEQHGPFASKDMIRSLVKAKNASVVAVMAELEAAGDIVRMEEGWIRDSERMRRERLSTLIRENGDWSRGKLVSMANVKVEHFERYRQQGLIAPRSSDPGIPGFVWTNPS